MGIYDQKPDGWSNNVQTPTPEKPWFIILGIIAIVFIFVQLGKGDNATPTDGTPSGDASTSKPSTKSEKSDDKLTLGSTFTFSDLEITVGTELSFDKVDNQFSEQHKATVVVLPLSVKNIDDESNGLSSLTYTFYNPDGVELTGVDHLFEGNGFTEGWKIRPGATKEVELQFLYEEDGEYQMVIKKIFGKETVLYIPVKKP